MDAIIVPRTHRGTASPIPLFRENDVGRIALNQTDKFLINAYNKYL